MLSFEAQLKFHLSDVRACVRSSIYLFVCLFVRSFECAWRCVRVISIGTFREHFQLMVLTFG